MKWYKRVPTLHPSDEEHQRSCWNPWCRERLRVRLRLQEQEEKRKFRLRHIRFSFSQGIVAQDDLRCFYCGGEMTIGGPRRMSRDHLLPLSRGGSDEQRNIVLACQLCNGDKGDLTLAEYRVLSAEKCGENPATFKFYGEASYARVSP